MRKKEANGDPIGAAILEYADNRIPKDIYVHSDICEDDIIPTEVLFRKEEEMPELELHALNLCKGKVLDVGSGAGAHARVLEERGLEVHCIEISEGAVQYMQDIGLNARKIDFFELEGEQYDTILFMMNGLGVAGSLANLEATLKHAKTLLKPGGQILCDSSDIQFLYMDEDGSMWVDLNSEYYGNFRFQMSYKKVRGPWFDWLYVDFDNLFKAAKNVGMKALRVKEQEAHYLAQIKV